MMHKGSCHCGRVKYEVEMDVNAAPGLTCNCSMCRRKGTVLAFVPAGKFHLLSGEDALTDYQFGKKSIHHYFCSTCGVTSFASGQMPDGTKMQAVNLRCLEDVDVEALPKQHIDGKSF